MFRLLALSLILGISALLTPCSNAQFNDCATSGENNATFAIQQANLNGSPLPNGSQIAIYGGANDQCGGVSTWDGSTLIIAVWENDGNNNGGLQVGEALVFKVWDTTTTHEDVSVDYASGPHINCDTDAPGTYRSNALCTIASVDVTAVSLPTAPTLNSPADGATDVSTGPALVWNPTSGADSYHLQLATDAGFSNLVVDQTGLTSTSHVVSGLDHATLYYWRVQASNTNGTSPWSTARDFTTEASPVAPLAAPTLSSPPDGARGVSTDLTLVWNPTSGADSYHLQLATDLGFSNFVVDQAGLTSTSYNVTGLNHQTFYYWRVRASYATDQSSWSNPNQFTTRAATATANDPEAELPDGVHLYNNYPNPFNGETTITFDVAQSTSVTLNVYDLLGKAVATLLSERVPAGRHEVRWEAHDVPSGIYFYRLQTDRMVVMRKLIVTK